MLKERNNINTGKMSDTPSQLLKIIELHLFLMNMKFEKEALIAMKVSYVT